MDKTGPESRTQISRPSSRQADSAGKCPIKLVPEQPRGGGEVMWQPECSREVYVGHSKANWRLNKAAWTATTNTGVFSLSRGKVASFS